MQKQSWTNVLVIATCALTFMQAPAAFAQVPGITVKPLLKSSVGGDDSKEATLVWAELAPGAALPRHTHPGDEYATVIEGVLEIRVAGQEPRRVTAGQAYHNARGVPHEARNVGDGVARLVVTFVLERNLPLSTPAPAQ